MRQHIKASYHQLRSTNILSNFFNLSSFQVSNLVLLLLTIRIVTVNVGIERFGLIMVAYKFSILAGAIINYGTNQSGIRDIAFNLTDTKKLSIIFFNTLWIRALIFLVFSLGLLIFYWFHANYYFYILLAAPVVLAEVFNPLYFFVGIEKIQILNLYNLIANVAAVLAIVLFIKGPEDAMWVNFILGMGNVITYFSLLVYLGLHFKLSFHVPLKSDLIKTAKDNFSLTINNMSANLQQSIILFALGWGHSGLLGPYSLCDRIIAQCRNLLNIVSTAIYPHAANIYKKNIEHWNIYRRKTKYLFAALAFIGAMIIFILADFIIHVLSKKHDADAVLILRVMAFVPIISALNVFSMLDLLLKNNTISIFKIAVILVIIGALVAFISVIIGNAILIAAFTLIIELSACLIYEYTIKKSSLQNG